MADKPAAELVIDEALVRRLVASRASEIPDAATLPLAHAADGWDCSVWRLGTELAVRLPRRAIAAPLVLHEQAALGDISRRLVVSGVRVPAPLVNGRADAGFPWPWSIVPWFDGVAGHRIPRAERSEWAVPLARALRELHVTAPTQHPINDFRGVPLAARHDSVVARMATLETRVERSALRAARAVWESALEAAPWSAPAVWIHGDLHPGNLIACGSQLVALIDFGDVTAGDPAYDLAVAWLAFDAAGRAEFMRVVDYDQPTWIRARGWAVAVALMLLNHSDDDPDYAVMGAEALTEILSR